jgi:hypothetical protein
MSLVTRADHVKPFPLPRSNFESDLIELGIVSYRVEPLNGQRRRVLVEHKNRTLAVSFTARTPNRRTAVVSKLRHALRELAGGVMAKPTTYRGVAFSITKGPSTEKLWGSTPVWHGAIAFNTGPERVREGRTKFETVREVERAIDVRLDYEGDDELYHIVESLVHGVTNRRRWQQAWHRQVDELPPTPRELCKVIDRACELAKGIVEKRYANSEQAALIAKLRAMTTERGCTPAEAEAALLKLQQLEGAAR